MEEPVDIATCFGPILARGDFPALAARYEYPCVIVREGKRHILNSADELIAGMQSWQRSLVDMGMVHAESRIVGDVNGRNDLAYMTTRTSFQCSDDRDLGQSQLSYVLRKTEGQWKIVTLSVDDCRTHSPVNCWLDLRAVRAQS